jgi:hypothetical protein
MCIIITKHILTVLAAVLEVSVRYGGRVYIYSMAKCELDDRHKIA